jgi:hypothetical protein
LDVTVRQNLAQEVAIANTLELRWQHVSDVFSCIIPPKLMQFGGEFQVYMAWPRLNRAWRCGSYAKDRFSV